MLLLTWCRAVTSLLFALTTFGLYVAMGKQLTPEIVFTSVRVCMHTHRPLHHGVNTNGVSPMNKCVVWCSWRSLMCSLRHLTGIILLCLRRLPLLSLHVPVRMQLVSAFISLLSYLQGYITACWLLFCSFPMVLNGCVEAIVSVRRLQRFFLAPEVRMPVYRHNMLVRHCCLLNRERSSLLPDCKRDHTCHPTTTCRADQGVMGICPACTDECAVRRRCWQEHLH